MIYDLWWHACNVLQCRGLLCGNSMKDLLMGRLQPFGTWKTKPALLKGPSRMPTHSTWGFQRHEQRACSKPDNHRQRPLDHWVTLLILSIWMEGHFNSGARQASRRDKALQCSLALHGCMQKSCARLAGSCRVLWGREAGGGIAVLDHLWADWIATFWSLCYLWHDCGLPFFAGYSLKSATTLSNFWEQAEVLRDSEGWLLLWKLGLQLGTDMVSSRFHSLWDLDCSENSWKAGECSDSSVRLKDLLLATECVPFANHGQQDVQQSSSKRCNTNTHEIPPMKFWALCILGGGLIELGKEISTQCFSDQSSLEPPWDHGRLWLQVIGVLT